MDCWVDFLVDAKCGVLDSECSFVAVLTALVGAGVVGSTNTTALFASCSELPLIALVKLMIAVVKSAVSTSPSPSVSPWLHVFPEPFALVKLMMALVRSLYLRRRPDRCLRDGLVDPV